MVAHCHAPEWTLTTRVVALDRINSFLLFLEGQVADASLYTCISTLVYAGAHVCLYTNTRIHACIVTPSRGFTPVYSHTHQRRCTKAHAYAHAHTDPCTYIHIPTRTQRMYRHARAHILMYIQTQACTHTKYVQTTRLH